jgi:DNA repair protein RadC
MKELPTNPNLFNPVQPLNLGYVFETVELLNSSQDVAAAVERFIGHSDREVFAMISLDAKNQAISIDAIHVGTLTSSMVSQQTVWRTALLRNACSVIFSHNHPSGDPEASPEDVNITKELCIGSNVLGIRVLDHVIIGNRRFSRYGTKYVSLREQGLMQNN